MNTKGVFSIGNALILSKEEFESGFGGWLKRTSANKEEQAKKLDYTKNGYSGKIEFNYVDEFGQNKKFYFVKVSKCDEQKLYFVPLYGNGDSLFPRPIEDGSYVVFADWSSFADGSFLKSPYEEFADIVYELKAKAEKIVPEGFDWDLHVGTILCSFEGNKKKKSKKSSKK